MLAKSFIHTFEIAVLFIYPYLFPGLECVMNDLPTLHPQLRVKTCSRHSTPVILEPLLSALCAVMSAALRTTIYGRQMEMLI